MRKLLPGVIITGALTLTSTPTFAISSQADVATPETYINHTIDQAIDVDGLYGCQCVDLFSDFHFAYTGRWLSTAGTGAAYGLWYANLYNAGDDYILITDPTQLRAGDIVIFSGGDYGHVGMATSGYHNGFVTLLGENQGGVPCAEGGSTTNIIEMSLDGFMGAFRPKIYIEKPKPVEKPVEKKEAKPEVKEDPMLVEIEVEKESTVDVKQERNTTILPSYGLYFTQEYGKPLLDKLNVTLKEGE